MAEAAYQKLEAEVKEQLGCVLLAFWCSHTEGLPGLPIHKVLVREGGQSEMWRSQQISLFPFTLFKARATTSWKEALEAAVVL